MADNTPFSYQPIQAPGGTPPSPTWADYGVLPFLSSMLTKTQYDYQKQAEAQAQQAKDAAEMQRAQAYIQGDISKTQEAAKAQMEAEKYKSGETMRQEHYKQRAETERQSMKQAVDRFYTRMDSISRLPEKERQQALQTILNTTDPRVVKASGYNIGQGQANPMVQSFLNGEIDDARSPNDIITLGQKLGLNEAQIKVAIDNWTKRRSQQGPQMQQLPAVPPPQSTTPGNDYWGQVNQGITDMWKNVPFIGGMLKEQERK